MKVVAIIQSRMGSTRLPGKSLVDISGRPLLLHVVDRVRASSCVKEVVVATTTDSADNAIEDMLREFGVICFRGSSDDVLDRYYQAACQAAAEIVVRVTADDPFKDPDVIDRVTEALMADESLDYVSNTIEPTFPEGLDIESFRMRALRRAWKDAQLLSEREHVTPYLWKHPEFFRLLNIRHDIDLSKLRWTLDYPQDLEFAQKVYARLYHGQIFKMNDVLRLLEHEPQLAEINAGILRNAGYQHSLQKEQKELP